MEKIPTPKPTASKVEAQEQYHHHPVEDVVAHGRQICEQCKSDPHAPGCEPELFHQEIASCEVGPIFNEYENGKVVSLRDVRLSVSRVVEVVSAIVEEEKNTKYGEELGKKLNLLKSRDREIQLSVGRYVTTLTQFYSIKQKRGGMDIEDFKERMEQIDRRRRQAHDSLIESLKIYSTLVKEFVSEQLLDDHTVVEWGIGQDVPDLQGNKNHIVIFAPSILANRELIKDWAISAELAEMMHDITEARAQAAK